MMEKSIFPYDYFNYISKHLSEEEINFPSRKSFFNKLSDSECSMKDYLQVKLVWNKINCQTFRNYQDIYLKSDVLLIADSFEKFREMCLERY